MHWNFPQYFLWPCIITKNTILTITVAITIEIQTLDFVTVFNFSMDNFNIQGFLTLFGLIP